MYSMVIADDEKWIRIGLKESINWMDYGIDEIYEADTGESALDIIKEKEIDLLITDIRMPDIDGLELIKLIKENDHHTKVIIISGYRFFEYAQKAIKYGACSYILKPIPENEIIEQVKNCIKMIEEERIINEERKDIISKWNENLDLICKKSIEYIFRNGTKNGEEVIDKLSICGFNSSVRTNIFGIYIDHFQHQELMSEEKIQDLKHFIELSMNNWIVKNKFTGVLGIYDKEIIYGCIQLKEGHDENNIIQYLKKCCNIQYMDETYTATIAISQSINNINDWKNGKRQVEYMINRRFFDGKGSFSTWDERVYLKKDIKQYYNIQNECLDKLMNMIYCYKEDELMNSINDLYKDINYNKYQYEMMNIKKEYYMLMSKVYFNLFNKHMKKQNRVFDELETLDDVHHFVSVCFVQWMIKYHKQHDQASQQIIRRLKEYIQNNFDKKINLTTCAEYLYMNPSYLSNLFSKTTSQTITHYITKVRLDKSKQLLMDSNLKVYEVANQVGYNDEKYFAKIFKENEGISPRNFRDNFRKCGKEKS